MNNSQAFDILGIEGLAVTAEKAKAAYREQSRRWHPDKAPAGKRAEYEQKMKEINEAYATLQHGARNEEPKMQWGNFTHTTAGPGSFYNQAAWDALKKQAEAMQKNYEDYLRQRRTRRRCRHCGGTGWTEEVEPNF